jgi:site-specific DNA recombinase
MTARLPAVRAGLYCRISDDRGGGGLGVERQRQDCVRLAKHLGWQVVETYIDNDVSAYSGKVRKNYERMLADLITGHIDGVVAWHLDRVNRSPVELERLIPILQRGNALIHTVTAGQLDLSTPAGQAMARFYSTIAKMECDHMGERMRRKKLETAMQGGITGGKHRPYGYADDKLTVIPAEAKLLREMMRRFLAGEATAAISRDLNRRGVPNTGPKPWNSTLVNRMLVSPRICGWRQVPASGKRPTLDSPAGFLAPAQWKGIVSRRDVERAQVMLGDDTLRPGSSMRWLLTGIALCGGCSQPMTYNRPKPKNDRYSCDEGVSARTLLKCGHISIDRQRLDDHYTASLHTAVKDGLISRVLALDDPFAADAAVLHADEMRLDQLGRDHDDGIITRVEWLRRKAHVHLRVVKERQAVRDMPHRSELVKMAKAPTRFPARWQALTVRQQRALVRALTASIHVAATDGGRRCPAADRVTIAWRA